MKLLRYISSIVLVSVLFIGCTSKEPSPYEVSMKKDKGTIVVYRPHNNIWKKKRFNIYIDDKYEDLLMNSSHHVFYKKPGAYKIELREDVEIKPKTYKIEISLSKGKVKYIKLGTNTIEDHLKLKSVRKTVAISDEWSKKRY